MTRRRLIILVSLLAALLLLWGGCSFLRKPDAPVYNAVSVTLGNVQETVSAQGKLEPRDYVDVGAQVSGQLEALYVDAGDVVSASQLLVQIDPRVYESRLKQTSASLKSLQAQMAEQQAALSLAKQQHARNTTMVESQAISKQEFDISAAEVKSAQARVNSLSAQLEQSRSAVEEEETNLGYTKIYAPMAGTVISTSVKAGQTINASQQAPTILTIANLGTMTVRAQVAEADVGRLAEGTPVTFTTLGTEREWSGTIRQILPAPEVVNDVVLYNVLVDADNTDGSLMSGMSTQMTFVIASATQVPTIPAGALGAKVMGKDAQPNTYRVKVMQGGKPTDKTVTVGLLNRNAVQIIEGLKVGDSVLMATPAASGNANSGGGMRRNMGPRL